MFRRGGFVQGLFFLLVICAVVFQVFCRPLTVSAEGKRVTVKTRHVTLVFNSVADMEKFSSQIDYPSGNSLANLFGGGKGTVRERLIHNIDLLFEKVQAILDMQKKMPPVRVRVFSNEEQLHHAYERIFHQKCTVRGWYFFEFNTVFLNVRDVHEGMLAHELGHAIIDHYLDVRPPRATAEILARYVDEHLFDEVKKY